MIAPTVYYESKTGNVKRFVNKIKEVVGERVEFIDISTTMDVISDGHLITYTTKIGQVPDKTSEFLSNNYHKIKTATCSGNMNWGRNYGLSLDRIVDKYPTIIKGFKFELSGTDEDIENYIYDILNIKLTNELQESELDFIK